jgi:hypothetical protein
VDTEKTPPLADLYSLPPGTKLRVRKFGANPTSPLVPTPVGGNQGASAAVRPEFRLRWEDQQQGLQVTVRERDNGHLIAEVFSTDPALLTKATVSVGLVGTIEDGLIRKTIPLDVPETTGCSGSADFGLLEDAVKELGSELGVVVFLLL